MYPTAAYPNEFLQAADRKPEAGAVNVTFLGTTTLLFDDGHTKILVDGFLSRPPLHQVIGGRIHTDTGLVDRILASIEAHRIAAVLVTHSHYDHALDVAYIARSKGAILFGSKSTLNIGRGGEVPEKQLAEYDLVIGEQIGQFHVRAIPSTHSPPIPFLNDDLGKTIDEPLRQPARFRTFSEGGSFDLLIRHGDQAVLVKGSPNYKRGALRGIRADVLFLPIGGVGLRSVDFHEKYYANTVLCIRPRLVIPVHWDSLFAPLSESLPTLPGTNSALRYLRERLAKDAISLRIVLGQQTVRLFDSTSAPHPSVPASIDCLEAGLFSGASGES